MIPKTYRATKRHFSKKTAKEIKKRILAKYPTFKSLAEELGVNPATLRGVINGNVYSKRMARMIEEAVGEKLFPYTQD